MALFEITVAFRAASIHMKKVLNKKELGDGGRNSRNSDIFAFLFSGVILK